ncbi:tetratricopeptide repeat protein [Thermococcus sp. Bubb.Bath]|uniref:tetratricopeptide repeat protein n=1 Tax=Thermococcus sp. Bubb.Bath TaxID=1638242 RepID=UPI00143A8D2A|nr:tetratricopeptide repeat protein [Thermococcus sp. Bubb.Bath]NJF24753.1 tetratricopeptide repeat protein [Thermococcus sp. Bubb.Bath]
MIDLDGYVRYGRVEAALNAIREEKDGIIRAELLAELLKRVEKSADYFEVRDGLINSRLFADDRKTKAIILSIIGEALFSTGDEDNGFKFLEEAVSTAKRIAVLMWRAEALVGVGLNLLRAGLYEDAYDLFNRAFEALTASRKDEPDVAIKLISKAAGSLVMGTDYVEDGEWAAAYLELAATMYESIGLELPARNTRARAELIRAAVDGNLGLMRRLLADNRVDDAVLMARYMPGQFRGLAMMEIAFWLYANDHPELGKDLFEDAYSLFNWAERSGYAIGDDSVFSLAMDFVKIGEPELASRLANFIHDDKLLSKLLHRIAREYYKQGDEFLAVNVARAIPDETIKNMALHELGGEVHVGYKQGLSIIRGGEKR